MWLTHSVVRVLTQILLRLFAATVQQINVFSFFVNFEIIFVTMTTITLYYYVMDTMCFCTYVFYIFLFLSVLTHREEILEIIFSQYSFRPIFLENMNKKYSTK